MHYAGAMKGGPRRNATSKLRKKSLERHLLLNLGNGAAGVQALGARPGTVENGVATVQAHGVLESLLALGLLLVTGVGEPAVGLEQDGRAEVLLRVPPVGGAGRGAAEAQNALVEAVELLAVLLALAVFAALEEKVSNTSLTLLSVLNRFAITLVLDRFAISPMLKTHIRSRRISLQVRLDRLVLLVQLGQIGHQILNDVGVRQRVDLGFGGVGGDAAQAGQRVDAVDVHGTRAADTLTARAAEGQRGVLLVLDANQRVEHHGARLVEVELERVHARLLRGRVGAPAVDLKALEPWCGLGGRVRGRGHGAAGGRL